MVGGVCLRVGGRILCRQHTEEVIHTLVGIAQFLSVRSLAQHDGRVILHRGKAARRWWHGKQLGAGCIQAFDSRSVPIRP